MDSKLREYTARVERKVQEYKSVFKNGGITGLAKAIGEELDEWKNEKINIAVTGETGSGKSTLINALRGLDADSEVAAPVGSTTTTTSQMPYPYPNNTKCILWDLPGVGADGFSQDKYLTKINVERFDFFVIVSGNRFTENDIFLAKAIEEADRHFFFVRTQFGDDLENESMKRGGKPPDENKLKAVVVSDCQKNLAEFKSLNNIFVIDSYMKDRFDFHYLSKRLVHDFEKVSEKKQVALTLTMSAMTREAIEEKKVILEKRIFATALKAAVAPHLFDSDTKILMEEEEFYRKQFGLDANTLAKDIRVSNIHIQLKGIISDLKREEKSAVAKTELNKVMEECIPFLSFFINIQETYFAGKIWLTERLNSLAESAKDINKRMIEGVATNDVKYASYSNSCAAK